LILFLKDAGVDAAYSDNRCGINRARDTKCDRGTTPARESGDTYFTCPVEGRRLSPMYGTLGDASRNISR